MDLKPTRTGLALGTRESRLRLRDSADQSREQVRHRLRRARLLLRLAARHRCARLSEVLPPRLTAWRRVRMARPLSPDRSTIWDRSLVKYRPAG